MENFSKGRDNRPVCSLRRFGGVTNGAKDRCIRCVTLIDYSPPPLPRSTTLDRVGAGFALAGGGGRRRGVKTTGKRAPVKSTWPDQSHSSSTRGHHRTSYLKWRTRRISPSLISTRRNFCIDVPPVSVYTGKAARRRRQGNFSDAHPRRGEPTDRVEQRERVFRNRIHIYICMCIPWTRENPVLQFRARFFGLGNMTGRRFKRRCFQRFTVYTPPFTKDMGNKRGRE